MYFRRIANCLLLLFLVVCCANKIYAGGFMKKLGIGFNVDAQKLYGDTRTGKFALGVNPIHIRFNFSPNAFLDTDLGFSRLSSNVGGATLNVNMLNAGFRTGLRLLRESKINPLVYIGGGVFNFQLGDGSRFWDAYGAVGAGLEFFLSSNIGLNLTGDFRYTTGSDFDGTVGGSRNDAILNLGLGFVFYLGGRDKFIPKPEFTQSLPEEISPLPFEEVVEFNEVRTANATHFENTSNSDLEKFALQKEELLKTKMEKEDLIKLLRLKLSISQDQIRKLEKKLLALNNYSTINTHSFNNKETEYFEKNYRMGLYFLQNGNYSEVISIFENLLKENLQEPLATLCLYWLGESYFANQDYGSAIEAFQGALKDPESLKKEVALLMLGLSRLKMGDISQAKSDFEKLVENYPNSQCAPLAKQYLAEISSKIYSGRKL